MKKLHWFIQHIYWNFTAYLYQPVLFFRGFKVRRKYTVDDIPRGDYCYSTIKAPCNENNWRHQIKCCPFLDCNRLAMSHSYGYCHLIKAGDWQWKGTMLLWDQCKCCAENLDDMEDN